MRPKRAAEICLAACLHLSLCLHSSHLLAGAAESDALISRPRAPYGAGEPRVRKLSARSLGPAPRHRLAQQAAQQGPNGGPSAPMPPNERANLTACPAGPEGGVASQIAGAPADKTSSLEVLGGDQFGQQRASFGFVQARLTELARPNFYTLRLKVDPNKRKFSGQLMVSLEIGAEQPAGNETNARVGGAGPQNQSGEGSGGLRYLTLHAGSNLIIRRAFYVFTARNSVQIPATRIGRDLERELLTLDFHPNAIPNSSQGLLLLVYSGLVNETDSHGLFLHHRGNQEASAAAADAGQLGLATQMEPSFARRLFPAWDEPSLKARFSLIVIQPFRGYESISNMPVKRKSISLSCSGEPLQEVEFHTTPAMSTYLLALVIGRFDYIESITQNNCKVRAYFYSSQAPMSASQAAATAAAASNSTTNSAVVVGGAEQTQQQQRQQQQQQQQQQQAPPLANQRRRAAKMALELAVKTFDRLEALLGVRYPLSKFDMVALRDFNSGAMENWGAAIFHENYLLCDNNSLNANIRVNGGTNRPRRLVVPLVVAHEIVHQWFGNLITSRSWTYLWLNEGFAQLLMYELAAALLPHENYWHIFMEDNRQSAMREDELITSSRALELDDEQVLSQDDQLSLFDQLTYNKGALLLRMVQHALGARDFLAGLRHYLLKHAYGSVASHDLWLALEESTDRLADRQLESLMRNWLKLEGLPLVSVQLAEAGDGAHYRLTLRQERFTLLPEAGQALAEATTAALTPAAGQGASREARNSNRTERQWPWAAWTWAVPISLASELEPEPSEASLRLWPLRAQPQDSSGGSAAAASQALSGNSILFQEKSASLLLAKANVGAWLKLNHKAIGYFRVHYEPPTAGTIDLLARLQAPIRAQTLGPIDRVNVAEDLFAMVLAGKRRLVEYLRFMLEAYEQERELLVLRALFDSFERVRQALVSNAPDEPAGQQLEQLFAQYVQRFVRRLIGALKSAAGAKVEPPTVMSHQGLKTVAGGRPARQRRETLTVANGGANGQQAPSSAAAAFISFERQLKRQQLKQQPITAQAPMENNSGNQELLELLDSVRLTYNEFAAPLNARQAADMFVRHHFRPTAADGGGGGGSTSPLDWPLGRELRASIYAAALNYHFYLGQRGGGGGGAQPTSATYDDDDDGGQVDELLAGLARNESAPAGGGGSERRQELNETLGGGSLEDRIFAKLLQLYEAPADSPAAGPLERSAIAQALGSVRNPAKQAHLVGLALGPSAHFRHQDASLLLEALVQSRSGRRLVWARLGGELKALRQRQLLAPALKSLARGLVEPAELGGGGGGGGVPENNGAEGRKVEAQLRELYVIYGAGEQGNLIGQAIEWVRINSQWFRRDHAQLAEYLAASAAAEPISGPPSQAGDGEGAQASG